MGPTSIRIEQVWGRLKSKELANLCTDTIDEIASIAEGGLDRIGSDASLCFAFLRHAGLRLCPSDRRQLRDLFKRGVTNEPNTVLHPGYGKNWYPFRPTAGHIDRGRGVTDGPVWSSTDGQQSTAAEIITRLEDDGRLERSSKLALCGMTNVDKGVCEQNKDDIS